MHQNISKMNKIKNQTKRVDIWPPRLSINDINSADPRFKHGASPSKITSHS